MKLQPVSFPTYVETHAASQLQEIRDWVNAHQNLSPPYFVEIGSNRGNFLKGLSALFPQQTCVGIEWKHKWSQLLQRELQAQNALNAHLLIADVNLALPLAFEDVSIQRLYMLFPDPWWKKRHAKRRLYTPAFLQLLAQKMPENALFILKTDVEPYYETALEVAKLCPQFAPVSPGDAFYPTDEDTWPRTTRERKIIAKGLPVWKLYLRRTNHPPFAPEDTPESPEAERFLKPDIIIDNPRARGGSVPK